MDWKLMPGPEHSPNVLTVVDEASGRTMCWIAYPAIQGGQRRARMIACTPDLFAICEDVLSGTPVVPSRIRRLVSYVKGESDAICAEQSEVPAGT